MSLTERQKEVAIEVFTAYMERAIREQSNQDERKGRILVAEMFDDFLSRIREEQEAVAEIALWPDDRTRVGLDWLIDELPPEGTKLFAIPPAAPCDCSELVEALENSRDVLEHLITHHRVVAGHQIAISCFERINEALTNHAKRMKLTQAIPGEE